MMSQLLRKSPLVFLIGMSFLKAGSAGLLELKNKNENLYFDGPSFSQKNATYRDPFFHSERRRSIPLNAENMTIDHYALDKLVLVGILTVKEKRWAFIKPINDRQVFKVAVGDSIGINKNKIVDITQNEVRLHETFDTIAGIYKIQSHVLSLKKNER